VSYFHHLVGGTNVSSFITFHHISSPGWWREDEFLLHLVGGMNGKYLDFVDIYLDLYSLVDIYLDFVSCWKHSC